jgi:hypothetical protein
MESINILDLSDDELNALLEKYEEKQERYELLKNELTEINKQKIILVLDELERRLITQAFFTKSN